nr:MAG TPA: Protein of unknown function (DUF739) [Caudoviricetes sp.]
MIFDYSKLRGRIIEKYGSQSKFAKEMKLSERTMSLKMLGRVEWKQSEIQKAVALLGLADKDICSYFFTLKVQNIEHN